MLEVIILDLHIAVYAVVIIKDLTILIIATLQLNAMLTPSHDSYPHSQSQPSTDSLDQSGAFTVMYRVLGWIIGDCPTFTTVPVG